MNLKALLSLAAISASTIAFQSARGESTADPVASASDSPVDAEETTASPKIDEATLRQIQEITKEGLFVETFETDEVFDGKRWFKSTHEKYLSQEVSLDEYTVETGHVVPEKGLVLDAPARHYGLAVKLDEPLQVDGSAKKKEMVMQYELKLSKGLTCGGAYLKLLRANASGDYSQFDNDTPFVVMFGPDKCGSNDKVHFIFQHKNPISGEYEEKHMKNPPQIKSDRLTHLYTLVVRDDNTYVMFIDRASVSKGSLLEDFSPAVLPPKEIEDATDLKPEDWVDDAEIPDPDAKKPEDWDEDAPARIPDEGAVKPEDWLDNEPAMIDDPSVLRPEDWDEEDDGDWLAPQIPNPKCEEVSGCGEWVVPTKANPAYKGKWRAPMIPNPAYKGEWAPRKIPNPAYFEDEHPARMDPIGALAIEVWTMSEGITFDNFWLGNDVEKAHEFSALTWAPKFEKEKEEDEKQREQERKEMEERKAAGAGFFNKAQAMATTFLEFAQANPVVGIGSAVLAVALLSFSFFMICCGKSTRKEKDESGDEKEEPEHAAEAVKKSTDSESKTRQRKKAPVVQDD